MIFTAESLQPKQGGPFLLCLHLIWIGIQKTSIQSPTTLSYRWEIPIPIDQEETKAEKRIKTHM